MGMPTLSWVRAGLCIYHLLLQVFQKLVQVCPLPFGLCLAQVTTVMAELRASGLPILLSTQQLCKLFGGSGNWPESPGSVGTLR